MTGICGAFDKVDSLHDKGRQLLSTAEGLFDDEFFASVESPYREDVDELKTTLEDAVDLISELCAVLEIDRDESM